MKKYPVVVALDGLTLRESIAIAKLLGPHVWGFKVHELMLREGFGVIKKLKKFGKVFVDLKLYDIPTTVGHEVAALAGYGADIISVHASGGKDMLQAAVLAGGSKVAAVTVLSSMHVDTRKMLSLASLAKAAGVLNIICAARDVGQVRKIAKSSYLITPGVRGTSGNSHDQKRTAGPYTALAAGANLLVIGRPITEAQEPLAALHSLFTQYAS